jgi:DNA polymerase-1
MTAPVSISEPTLLLVDGSSYLYRAFHAMPDLRGPGNIPTGAIHGMVNMLGWIRDHLQAEHAVCVFDAKGPTFRDEWYPEYKAHRPSMPEDLRAQIEPIHEVVKLLGWPVLEVPGIEADDAIGTLARVGVASGHKVVISTGDKDMAQLVNDRVSLINTMAKPPEVLDEAGVLAKFGVPPERIIDYLTLIGDAVDNVPGVEKVGPKTAAKWIAEYGSLEGVLAAAPTMKGAAGEHLRKALDWLPQGRRLVTVATDCDLTGHVPGWPAFDSLRFAPIDAPALAAMRSNAFLINVARGAVVDTAALVDALRAETIAGAGLDVYEAEPPNHPELLALDNVVLCPHICAATREALNRMTVQAAQMIIEALEG